MPSTRIDLRSPLPDDPDFRYLARLMDILREERVRQELTGSAVCKKACVGNGSVGRAERYERFPTIPILRKISRALGLEWGEICCRAELPTTSHPL